VDIFGTGRAARRRASPLASATPALVEEQEDGLVELLGLLEGVTVGDPRDAVSKSMGQVAGSVRGPRETSQQAHAHKHAEERSGFEEGHDVAATATTYCGGSNWAENK
jgi:hypothetical protein